MVHIWWDRQQDKYRVWNSIASSWYGIDSLSVLNTLTFLKSSDKAVCLYLPTHSFSALNKSLKASQIKQLGKTGLQYLFEDLSLSPVEQLKTLYLSEGDKRYFYALAEAEIEQWKQSVELIGYKLTALIPDFILLPSPDAQLNKQLTLYSSGGTFDSNGRVEKDEDTHASFIARLSYGQGIAVSHFSLLPRLLNNIEEVVYISDDGGATKKSLTEQLHQLANEAGIVIIESEQSLLPVSYPIKHPLNFIETKRNYLVSPYLTRAAIILILAGITQISADLLQWYDYKEVTLATKEATNEQYAAWFNGDSLNQRVAVTNQVSPRLINSQSTTQQQLSLISQLSPLIKQSNLVTQSLRWNDASMTLTVKGEDRSSIDKLQQRLNAQGLSVNLGTVTPSSTEGIIADLSIELTANGLNQPPT